MSEKWPAFDRGKTYPGRIRSDYGKDACTSFLAGFKDPTRCRRCGWLEGSHPGDPIVAFGPHSALIWHGNGAYRSALFAFVAEALKYGKKVQEQRNQKQGSLFG